MIPRQLAKSITVAFFGGAFFSRLPTPRRFPFS